MGLALGWAEEFSEVSHYIRSAATLYIVRADVNTLVLQVWIVDHTTPLNGFLDEWHRSPSVFGCPDELS